MRGLKLIATAGLWIALATLMPMAALEPVTAAEAPERPLFVAALCPDGSALLAMGCESIHL